jgi:cytochrome c-type biogenesis protein CcmH
VRRALPGRETLLLCAALGAAALSSAALYAATPVDVYEFSDGAQEARYRLLIAEFRCPKCLNTNLAGSDAPIAQDLRRTVHRLLVTEGRSDAEIRDYLQTRYGDFVLYDPPLKPSTYVLWFAPALFLMIGAGVIVVMVRRARQAPPAALSASDAARLRQLLEDD